jgi:hypothetical protein
MKESRYGCCVLDCQWHFTYVNPSAEHFLGRAASDLLGNSLWEMFPEAMDSKLYAIFQTVAHQQVSAFLADIRPTSNSRLTVHVLPIEHRLLILFNEINEAVECGPQVDGDGEVHLSRLGQSPIVDRASSGAPLSPSSFYSLAFDRVFSSLLDIRSITKALVHSADVDAERSACHLFECPRLRTLAGALTEAISVLEKTKGSFKSKELAELRKRLEATMKCGGQEAY